MRFMSIIISERAPASDWAAGAEQTVRRSFVVNIEHGMHARPCALLVKTLLPFQSEVSVEANGERASGNSIMGLMALAAGLGCSLAFSITGPDAHQAMGAIERLFATHFAEAYRSPKRPAAAGEHRA